MGTPPRNLHARQELVTQIRRLGLELDELARTFAALHALHPTDVKALVLIMDAGRAGAPLTPGRLGTELNLTSASVTALLDRLERVGHVRRVRDQRDRRRVVLHAEQQALALGAEFFGPLNARMLAAMDGFTDAELEVVDDFLTRTIAAVAAEQRR